MLKIRNLSPINYLDCHSLLNRNLNDKKYFENIGWSLNQFKKQLLKKNNFSLALFQNNMMISFIIGDIISIEKILEYEILLIYVSFKYRKQGYASKLLNEIPLALAENNLEKIYLEVSSDNLAAINLYKNNNFIKTGVRKKYYKFQDKKMDAHLFEKKL